MNSNIDHEYFMSLAIEMAKQSLASNEVPVGAIIVCNNKVIGKGYNLNISRSDPTAHAEINALRNASKLLTNYRLNNCQMYVTLEPCIMCLGAIFHARIEKLFYSAIDQKTGACGGYLDLTQDKAINHHCEIVGGILANETSALLKEFFKNKRQKKPQT